MTKNDNKYIYTATLSKDVVKKYFNNYYNEKETKIKIYFNKDRYSNLNVLNLYNKINKETITRNKIVASLIHEPKVLFLDEPTIGLDPVVKENIRTLIKRMNKEYKTTVVLTSHDVSDIEKLCKRVIIVNKGQIVLDDSMENLKYHYLNKKIVEAKMKEPVNLNDEEGITILKDKGYNLKIEVDTKAPFDFKNHKNNKLDDFLTNELTN